MSTTIKEIARLANVSHTTVSRALNESVLIKDETKKRIKELAKKLNYIPNYSAKSLVLDKSYNIGLFASKSIENLHTSFLYEVMEGVNSQIGDEYNVIYRKFNSIDDVDEKIKQRRYDGIMFLSMDISDIKIIYKLAALNIPMVALNRNMNDTEICCVYADEYDGAFSAAEHLIRLGHQNIAIILGPEIFITSKERYNGYKDALEKYGLPLVNTYAERGGFTPESGYIAMENLMKVDPRPTAVFVTNDLMAVGAIKACNQNGLKVPGDISIMGFDDMDFSRYLIPSLTTVKKSRRSIGRQGALMLLDLVYKRDLKIKAGIVKTELILRESCANKN